MIASATGLSVPCAVSHYCIERLQPIAVVLLHAMCFQMDQPPEVGQPILHGEQFSDLLMVFRDHDGNAGVVQHLGDPFRLRIRPKRHAGTAEALRRQQRRVKPRAVVADHRERVTAPEAMRGKIRSKLRHHLCIVGPVDGLPDAMTLFAHRRPLNFPRWRNHTSTARCDSTSSA